MFIVKCNRENEHDGDDCISISQSTVSVLSGRKARIKFTEADVKKIWSKFGMLITGNLRLKRIECEMSFSTTGICRNY